MGNAIAFDTLAYTKKLIAAGIQAKHAEVHAEALAEIIDERIATKQDLKEMEGRIIVNSIKWVAGMLIAQAAIVATLVKLL